MKDLKVIFMGTPMFCVPILEKLVKECNVIGVVTQPDKEVGRKREIEFSPVKKIALENNIKIFQPRKIREEYQMIIDMNPDIIITCAYGQIIPKELLFFPKYKSINIHASLLPKYRGGAPIHWSIINGDNKTGITIMYMDIGMDDGDIISQEEIEITKLDTLKTLEDKLCVLGRDLLMSTLPSIIEGTNKRIKQETDKVTYAKIIKREDEFVDFKETALNVYNKVRGLNPIPGASVYLDGRIVKLYEVEITNTFANIPGRIESLEKDSILVSTKDYIVKIKDVKFEGKKRMLVKDLINGLKDKELIGKFLEKGN